ncbi:hypothetical protein CYLTODRAFT_490322 [Cylindrobasidium torrendii FP15055 ss-10]|uniref:Uncharacterized protein n=1 Tax=Cylindrobasidium torrendii FP15055 ss-10 TaxID=1314674 RepID=A0A0D7BC78_9AGAR|nr:hypothetical protein CYLTODRAFT_490322 [Cylindrobasidium torrendii FP15055 ss-10]
MQSFSFTAGMDMTRYSYIFVSPASRRNFIARTLTRNAFSRVYIQRDHLPKQRLCPKSKSSVHSRDVPAYAQPCQALWQLGEALARVHVVSDNGVIVYCDQKRCFTEEVLARIIHGNCDIQELAKFFCPTATASLCWIACKLIDIQLQGATIQFLSIRPEQQLSLARLESISPEDTPEYDLNPPSLLQYTLSLITKAESDAKHHRYLKILKTMVEACADMEKESGARPGKRSSDSDDMREPKSNARQVGNRS